MKVIETAQAFRKHETVKELAQILSDLPTKEHQLIGEYYTGWLALRRGEDAQAIFERVFNESSSYKAKASLSLAALEARKQNFEGEFNLIKESLKFVSNPADKIELARAIAVVKAKEGFHHQSVSSLEALIPLLPYAPPNIYYACLNSLAVELNTVGRNREASEVCNYVLQSPISVAYPEWQETREEIAMKARQRSRLAIRFKPTTVQRSNNIAQLPLPKPGRVLALPNALNQIAQVYSLQQWKSKMVKETGNASEEKLSLNAIYNMSRAQKRVRIMKLIYDEKLGDEELTRLLQFAEEISLRERN